MRKIVLTAALAATVLALGACSRGGSRSGVFARNAPDEFAVARQAPLVIPPDFALNPPRPGAPRPQEADSSTQALQAMFGGPARASAGEAGLLNSAGVARTDPAIRSQTADPTTVTADKGATTRDIIAAPPSQGAEATVSTPQ